MEQLNRADYIEAVKAIKEAIQISRYRAAKLVNKEVLALYYAVGRYISLNSRHASYGSSALRVISDQLQQEMPGLKGFSESSLKRMRKFYEDWSELIENRPPVADDLNAAIIPFDNQHIIIRPLAVDEFTPEQLQQFLSVPFIHHYEILTKTSTIEERLFYIRQCATHFWTKDKLIANLKADIFHKEAAPNNFQIALPDSRLRSLVAVELKSGKFKPEYAGKMNFYLSALDEYVKMPDENPSIGIILCRSMNEKKVEFSFRDMTKPMGVATYHSSSELPEAYKNILPSAEELSKLL